MSECLIADGLKVGRQRHFPQALAVPESLLPNGSEALGQGHGRQASTATKSIRQRSDSLPNDHLLEAAAPEGSAPQELQAILYLKEFEAVAAKPLVTLSQTTPPLLPGPPAEFPQFHVWSLQ